DPLAERLPIGRLEFRLDLLERLRPEAAGGQSKGCHSLDLYEEGAVVTGGNATPILRHGLEFDPELAEAGVEGGGELHGRDARRLERDPADHAREGDGVR